MNEYQTKLYNDLMTLCDTSESFFFKDEPIGHNKYGFKTFRIFNYRLCSYSDFLNESALECRGIMFEVDLKGNPIRLASLPMNKFFNYREVSSDINTLVDRLISDGRLSKDVYERIKNRDKN
jgi:Straboviridae RNA ligase 1